MKISQTNIKNLSNPSMAVIEAKWCQSFFSRLKGFTFRSSLGFNEGLVLVEARDSRLDTSIHMFFVFTDLSIAWVSSELTVMDIAYAKPWRPFYASVKPARYVIEFDPKRHGDFKIGDKISFEHV